MVNDLEFQRPLGGHGLLQQQFLNQVQLQFLFQRPLSGHGLLQPVAFHDVDGHEVFQRPLSGHGLLQRLEMLNTIGADDVSTPSERAWVVATHGDSGTSGCDSRFNAL